MCESPQPQGWHPADTGGCWGLFSSPVHGVWLSDTGRGHKHKTVPHQWGQRRTHSETRARSHAVQQPPDHSSPDTPLLVSVPQLPIWALRAKNQRLKRSKWQIPLKPDRRLQGRESSACCLPGSHQRGQRKTPYVLDMSSHPHQLAWLPGGWIWAPTRCSGSASTHSQGQPNLSTHPLLIASRVEWSSLGRGKGKIRGCLQMQPYTKSWWPCIPGDSRF